MKTRTLFLLAALAVSLWEGSPAMCESNNDKADEISRPVDSTKSNSENAAKRYLRMDEVEILGEVEKPKAMFVIPRAPLSYGRKEFEKDFTKDILNPINRQWVEDRQRWRSTVPPP